MKLLDMLALLMEMQLVRYVEIKDGILAKNVIQFLAVLFYVKHKLDINALKKIILV